ncbi:NUDIX hydrolase [Candidatus Daviesbacteria bacterium]|nr:NUDIX hydrolase [Candidatus Daviesbacteria bacterium]
MTYKASHDSETPANGQQILTAGAFIHKKFNGIEKVFLPKRAVTKKFLPGIYELPGGHIDFGENMIGGLKREVKEENEMEINVGDPFYVFTYANKIKGSHSIEVIYFATFINPITQIKTHPEDHSEYKWFSENEMDEVMINKGNSDPEFQGILKGFSLLKGSSLNFG